MSVTTEKIMTITDTTRVKLMPVGTTSGFLVICADCGRDLGQLWPADQQVPDERTAYCNAGSYVHDCRGKKAAYNPCPKCGTTLAYGDHELQYCPNPRCPE